MGNMSSLYFMVRQWSLSDRMSANMNHSFSSSSASSSYGRMSTTTVSRSREEESDKCNYLCPNCQKTGKLPTLSGRFFIINDTECQCNACYSIFNKKLFYKSYSTNTEADSKDASDVFDFSPSDKENKNPYHFTGLRHFIHGRKKNPNQTEKEEMTVRLAPNITENEDLVI
jgi:hypothetical protein